MKVALLIDNNSLTFWQYKALKIALPFIDLKLILNCTNTKTKKNFVKHFFYYLINLFLIQSHYTAKININKKFSNFKFINFKSKYSQNWQIIPNSILEEIQEMKIELIIKFGLNLLKVKNLNNILNYGVISFHHGDPSKYRGRPAGFYEIINKEETMGIIIQKINNSIDKGEIIAQAKSSIYFYSYSKTIKSAFENSQYLLKKAIINIKKNKSYINNYSSQIHKLPNNFLAIYFLILILKNLIKKILYLIFYEKKWNISVQENSFSNLISNINYLDVTKKGHINKKFSFVADPFFINKDTIIAEGFNKKNLFGELVLINSNNLKYIKTITNNKKNHFSYPFILSLKGNKYILPEVATWSKPFLINELDYKITYLKGLENYRLIDPTYIFHNNVHYIYSGLKYSPLDKLFIFYSHESFFGPYKNHTENPVNINPLNSRMAGNIIKYKNQLYRISQDNTNDYGNGIIINLIKVLDPNTYEEEILKRIYVKNFYGPHTLNIFDKNITFDFYYHKFNLLAGVNRIRQKIKL